MSFQHTMNGERETGVHIIYQRNSFNRTRLQCVGFDEIDASILIYYNFIFLFLSPSLLSQKNFFCRWILWSPPSPKIVASLTIARLNFYECLTEFSIYELFQNFSRWFSCDLPFAQTKQFASYDVRLPILMQFLNTIKRFD